MQMQLTGKRAGMVWLFVLILALILVPFALFGDRVDAWVATTIETGLAPGAAAALVVGLLAIDAPLPVPSSVVAVAGGAFLGPVYGSLAVFAGLTFGSAIGYGMGWYLGPVALTRFGTPLATPKTFARIGPGLLIVTRAIPVLAETMTIASGALRLPLPQFVPPVLLANAGLGLFFGVTGAAASEQGSFLIAFVASIFLPLIGYLGWQWFGRR